MGPPDNNYGPETMIGEVGAVLERRLGEMLVELADTLVVGFDVIDLLVTLTEQCVELLQVDAAGILLADLGGTLSLAAASDDQVRLLELLQLHTADGPCVDCFHSGVQVTSSDLQIEPRRWPAFTRTALEHGFLAVTAVPMRLRQERLGAMGLFRAQPGSLDEEQLRAAQTLADMATIGILHERAFTRSEVIVEQLQGALNSRVIIEQARGVVAERGRISVTDAFTVLRHYARDHSLPLSALARAVVDQAPEVADLLDTTSQHPGSTPEPA